MKLNKLTRLVAWLASSLVLSSAASAGFVWTEQGPGAGSLPATAQVVLGDGALLGINGALQSTAPVSGGFIYEVDVYRIGISNFNSFSARTVSSNPDDTALFLFDSAGQGVYMNDDNAGDLLSTLPAGDPSGPTSNGTYFLAVALGGYEAFADIGNSIANFFAGGFTDVRGGDALAGPVASWATPFPAATESPFSYSIELTGAVPEPATLVLVLFALAGVTASRRNAAATRH